MPLRYIGVNDTNDADNLNSAQTFYNLHWVAYIYTYVEP